MTAQSTASRTATIIATVLPDPSPDASAGMTTESTSTRKRLLDAAYELLLDEGYNAATVQSVARRANLTTGAIYANFANKHELLVLAVLTRWGRSQVSPIRETPSSDDTDQEQGRSRRNGLTELLVRHLSTPPAPEHRLLTEVTGAALRDKQAESLLRSGVEQIESLAHRSIEQAKADGHIDQTLSSDALVGLVVNLYLGAITSKSFDLPQPPPEEVAKVLATLNLASSPEGS